MIHSVHVVEPFGMRHDSSHTQPVPVKPSSQRAFTPQSAHWHANTDRKGTGTHTTVTTPTLKRSTTLAASPGTGTSHRSRSRRTCHTGRQPSHLRTRTARCLQRRCCTCHVGTPGTPGDRTGRANTRGSGRRATVSVATHAYLLAVGPVAGGGGAGGTGVTIQAGREE